jgi:hypothetical protein
MLIGALFQLYLWQQKETNLCPHIIANKFFQNMRGKKRSLWSKATTIRIDPADYLIVPISFLNISYKFQKSGYYPYRRIKAYQTYHGQGLAVAAIFWEVRVRVRLRLRVRIRLKVRLIFRVKVNPYPNPSS